MKSARGNRSAKWLSDRTAELGYRVSPTVIAKLDSGHRGEVLSVAELIILAAALDVPPLALLYPNLPDGEVERIPGDMQTAAGAAMWFTGESEDDLRRLPDRLDGDENDLTRLLRLTRMREGQIFRAERQEAQRAKVRARGGDPEQEWPRIGYDSMIRDIENVLREIRGSNVTEWHGPFGVDYEVDSDDA